MFAGLSALGLVPIAGDTAKAVSKIGRFAIKNLDNVAKVADIIEFTSKYYPDAVKLLAKNDDFVSAAKAMSNNTSLKMTKKDAERINKILEDAGLSEYAIKGSTDVRKLFKTQSLLEEHYVKHGQQIADVLGKTDYSIDDYLSDANYIIANGSYAPELNGYVTFMSGDKYGFVGLDRATSDITTFHIKTVSELMKKAPSLGFEK